MERIAIPDIMLKPGIMDSLSPARLDALKEVASIGAGHAATALSLMTGARIMIRVPKVNVGQLSQLMPEIAAADASLVTVSMDMHGSLTGQTLLALPPHTGHRLVDLLLRRERRDVETAFDMLEQSALKEAGNILGGAYMTALSEFLEMQLMPSPPRLRIATPSQIIEECGSLLVADCGSLLVADCPVCCVETEFSFEEIGERFRGFFLLLPDPESFNAIFRAVRLN